MATVYPAYKYIISRWEPLTSLMEAIVADPIFATVIGLGAAVTRINREEQEKGYNASQTITTGVRRAKLTLGIEAGSSQDVKARPGGQ